jgi:6-pyruvoyl tetrahydropterin synthase/QueD family protein
MRVSYTHEIPMGHRLLNHPGRCRHAHGHNYLVTVSYDGQPGVDGMVMDFSWLKKAVRSALDKYDHAFALQAGDPLAALMNDHAMLVMMDEPPTAEMLAIRWRAEIASALQIRAHPDMLRVEVTVHETRDCAVHL